MTDSRGVEGRISLWMEEEEAGTHYPDRLLSATFEHARELRQVRSRRWRTIPTIRSRPSRAAAGAAAFAIGAAAFVIVGAGALGLNFVDQPRPAGSHSPDASVAPSLPAQPSVDLGIFEPISGLMVYGNDDGIWGYVADGQDVKLTAGAGNPLGWSRDGTRLLVEGEHLFILHADGSETQLTTDSLRVGAATLAPDGSRVLYEGKGVQPGLFAVDADGGPAEMVLELEGLEGMSFSPDGMQIAYVTGSGDHSHRVSVMDADGTNAREILANDVTLGAGHDHGIAWSPAGDRIALGIEGSFYTFAPDGSGFTVAHRTAGRVQPFWSPDGSQLETRGPWHPGVPAIIEPAPSP